MELIRSRTIRATAVLAGAVAALLLSAAGASASPPEARAADRIADVCRTVLGAEPGTTVFLACQENLSRSAQLRGQADHAATARTACLARGLASGSVALSECELDAPPPVSLIALPSDPLPRAPRGYVGAGNAEIRRREQHACAYIGLDPNGAAFDGCVAGLASSLFAAENPSQ